MSRVIHSSEPLTVDKADEQVITPMQTHVTITIITCLLITHSRIRGTIFEECGRGCHRSVGMVVTGVWAWLSQECGHGCHRSVSVVVTRV